MPILEVKNLSARYSNSGPEILKDLSFSIEADDFFAVIGPSGAGKSTLIRCINRLVEPTGGKVILYGTDVLKLSSSRLRQLRRNIGMIFQEFNLVNRMSVMDNVLSGRLGYIGTTRSLFKLFPRSDIEQALRILDRVGLLDIVLVLVSEIVSAWARKRVAKMK